VESFVRQFQAGKRSWVDVLNSQREATQAALSYVDVYFNAQSLASRIDLLAKPGDAK
jgi:adhesin transport system outer membrane protein